MATLKTRIQNKHDVEENWNKATGFTPMEGELIIYDADSTHSYKRLKIGDGITNVINLPFFNDNLEMQSYRNIINIQITFGHASVIENESFVTISDDIIEVNAKYTIAEMVGEKNRKTKKVNHVYKFSKDEFMFLSKT